MPKKEEAAKQPEKKPENPRKGETQLEKTTRHFLSKYGPVEGQKKLDKYLKASKK